MSNSCQPVRQVGQRQGPALKRRPASRRAPACGWPPPARGCGRRSAWPPARSSRRRRRTARWSPLQVLEQCAPTHRRGGHADENVGADLGGGARLLGHRSCAGTLVSVVPSVPADRPAHACFIWTEDLRLAQHHRIQPGGDAGRHGAPPSRCPRTWVVADEVSPDRLPRGASQSNGRGIQVAASTPRSWRKEARYGCRWTAAPPRLLPELHALARAVKRRASCSAREGRTDRADPPARSCGSGRGR